MPLRWFTCGERRSSCVSDATISFMKTGTRTGTAPASARASWSMMRISSAGVSG